MRKLTNINKIFIYDDLYAPESVGMNNIELAVSKDNNVYFDGYGSFDKPYQDMTNVSFENYKGIIYIPKITSVDISATIKTVVGIVNSPMSINTYGSVNIEILQDSGLELCLENTKNTLVNNLVCKRNGRLEGEYNYKGEKFDSHRKRYSNYLLKNMDETKIIKTNKGRKLKYERIYDIKNIDVCDYNNLVYIKSNNSNYITYESPSEYSVNKRIKEVLNYKNNRLKEYMSEIFENPEKKSDNKPLELKYLEMFSTVRDFKDKQKIISNLQKDIESAAITENYELAAKLRDVLNNNIKK